MTMFRRKLSTGGLLTSRLYDQDTFYKAFIRDLGSCRNEVIIESPFITRRRMDTLLPIFKRLVRRGVTVIINTREPIEHDEPQLAWQAQEAIGWLHEIGATVLFTGRHHRKLAILDRDVLWEGSLNILSQKDSCEIMRRTESADLAKQLLNFTGLGKFLN